jgi:hypothetical protein
MKVVRGGMILKKKGNDFSLIDGNKGVVVSQLKVKLTKKELADILTFNKVSFKQSDKKEVLEKQVKDLGISGIFSQPKSVPVPVPAKAETKPVPPPLPPRPVKVETKPEPPRPSEKRKQETPPKERPAKKEKKEKKGIRIKKEKKVRIPKIPESIRERLGELNEQLKSQPEPPLPPKLERLPSIKVFPEDLTRPVVKTPKGLEPLKTPKSPDEPFPANQAITPRTRIKVRQEIKDLLDSMTEEIEKRDKASKKITKVVSKVASKNKAKKIVKQKIKQQKAISSLVDDIIEQAVKKPKTIETQTETKAKTIETQTEPKRFISFEEPETIEEPEETKASNKASNKALEQVAKLSKQLADEAIQIKVPKGKSKKTIETQTDFEEVIKVADDALKARPNAFEQLAKLNKASKKITAFLRKAKVEEKIAPAKLEIIERKQTGLTLAVEALKVGKVIAEAKKQKEKKIEEATTEFSQSVARGDITPEDQEKL